MLRFNTGSRFRPKQSGFVRLRSEQPDRRGYGMSSFMSKMTFKQAEAAAPVPKAPYILLEQEKPRAIVEKERKVPTQSSAAESQAKLRKVKATVKKALKQKTPTKKRKKPTKHWTRSPLFSPERIAKKRARRGAVDTRALLESQDEEEEESDFD